MTKTELENMAYNLASWKNAGETRKLYNCSASVIKDIYNEFVMLRSYSTITAIADLNGGRIYVFDYYSATSTQHAYKFKKYLDNLYNDDFKVVKLWSHSGLKVKEKQALKDCDYSSLIKLSTR